MWWPGEKHSLFFMETMPDVAHMHMEENEEGVGMWNCMKGQLSSSTRMELGSFITTLTRNAAIHMGIDCQIMVSKATKMFKAANEWVEDTQPT